MYYYCCNHSSPEPKATLKKKSKYTGSQTSYGLDPAESIATFCTCLLKRIEEGLSKDRGIHIPYREMFA